MKILRRIYRLLQAEERRKLVKMALTVFVSALLNFASLAALLPVLYFLLDEGGRNEAALFFCILAIGVIIFKGILGTFFLYSISCWKRVVKTKLHCSSAFLPLLSFW